MENFKCHLINSSSSLKDGLISINQLTDEILCLFVLDDSHRLVGTLTDGDIRRALISGIKLTDKIESAMHKKFEKLEDSKISPSDIKRFRIKGIKLLPKVDKDGKISRVYNLLEKQTILPVDAVLMAGGKGIRLGHLTEKTPKPLLKIGEKAIIDYNIDRLFHFGVENIHVTVNYLADQIVAHFLNEINGIKIECIKEPKYLGTIGSVKFIPEFYNDTILVMNSDLFTNIDFEEFYDIFLKSEADMAIAAIPYSVSVPYGIFKLEGINVKGLDEKPTYDYYANAGIYFIRRVLLDLIPDNTYFDATDFIELLIKKKYKVIRFPLLGYWIDIGKPEDLIKAREFAKHMKS
jgi:dTDP-glucose pyrophosphorylase